MPKLSLLRRWRGFTLIELLVVIAIIAILIGLLVPAVQKVREAAARTQCGNNLHNLSIACHNRHDQLGKLPPMTGYDQSSGSPPGTGGRGGWTFHLLPYIEQDNLYKLFPTLGNQGIPIPTPYDTWGQGGHAKFVKTYQCPSDPSCPVSGIDPRTGWGCGTYACNATVFGTVNANYGLTDWYGSARIPATFQDGTSNTIMFGEKYAQCSGSGGNLTFHPWNASGQQWGPQIWNNQSNGNTVIGWPGGPAGQNGTPGAAFLVQPTPYTTNCNPAQPSTPHTGGMLVAMGDASTRSVSSSISTQTLWYAVTPSGGEVLGSNW